MNKKERFKEIKGNCVDLIMTSHYDHCVDREDDCRMSHCPQMKTALFLEAREGARCPTCGSAITAPEMETIKRSWKPFWQGAISGVLGCIGFLIGLWVLVRLTTEDLKIIVTLP